jgi:glycosyltransferase involved in cell wall biosynthesis
MVPATWSGTPSRLGTAFQAQGHEVTGVHSVPGRLGRIGAALSHLAQGFHSELKRTALHRRLALSKVQGLSAYPDADLVIHTGTLDGPVRRVGAKALHVCYVDCTWSSWAAGDSRARALSSRQIRAIHRFERQSLHAFDHIFPIGAHVVDEMINGYGVDPRRITPVGTGMGGVDPFRGTKDYRSRKVLCIAKERHRDKGVHLLVEAFARLKRFHPDARLTIIGGAGVADELPAQSGLTLTGRVSKEELERHLQEACLFAMPAMNEPWGLVFLEALAQRVPILGLRRNALPEIAGEGRYGFLVDEAVPEAIAMQMASVLDAPDKLEAMGAAGQKHVLNYYTWAKTSERILAKLTQL